jgi:DNA-binding transcriptional ArsR family regulator
LTIDDEKGGVVELLERGLAVEYASWFKALADPTRVQLVELIARAARPMSVGELTAAMGIAQSTVSQHLKILAAVRFVLSEPVGTARLYRLNAACIGCFPSAADVVMGKPVALVPDGSCP